MVTYTVRETRAEDWRAYRDLRLDALRDPVAPIAFFEPLAEAMELPRADWENRSGSHGQKATFIGELPDGSWAGMVVVFTTEEGFAQIVGVYLAPGHRGTGLAEQLMRAAVEWAAGREVRLHVHENNKRAARFYERLGFRPTGASRPDPREPTLRAFELALRGPGPGPAQPGPGGSGRHRPAP
ncbi:GNAT family N-acetyltransferase [Streptomyces aidingensis]|uniref:Ribosomal protein S18 acetylase RimI n=1 Tax=Streptomyces aidingensis TaxID=910347 RepID=A0A1I1DYE1_9ACTN|nr:GNAT family N-acetyltransferase [Streptomyces aidingensis]SFB79844.1 Ribosomal protein S18 acetylase RimI [Streptomyces aidingensis]